MTITQSAKLSARQKRNLRNAIAVNSLKMASGCARCGFKPQSWAECRLLDLNHFGDGAVGAWATKSQNKHDNVARMVWGGTSLPVIMDEIAKGEWLCKNCHCMEHVDERQFSDSDLSEVMSKVAEYFDSEGIDAHVISPKN